MKDSLPILPSNKASVFDNWIKDLHTRIEIDGNLRSMKEIGRCTKTGLNLGKKSEDLYDWDDKFINDEEEVSIPYF